MKSVQNPHPWVELVLGAALLGVGAPSLALGLGQGQADVAVMGRRLSFSVPLRLELGEEANRDCVSAEVYFGNDKLEPEAVRVAVQSGARAGVVAQVTTTVAVDEPVVTIQVTAGCHAKISRKYVLLSDPPGSTPEASAFADAPALAAPSGPSRASGTPAQPKPPRRVVAVPLTPTSLVSDTGLARQMSPRLGTPQPVLQLDQGALDVAGPLPLRMGDSLNLPADLETDTPQRQVQRAAAAARWRALQTTAEQVALDQSRLIDLERQVGQFQALQAKQEANQRAAAAALVANAASQAQEAQHDEVRRIRIFGLLAVALLGLAGYAYLRWRDRTSPRDEAKDWWQGWAPGTVPAGGNAPLPEGNAVAEAGFGLVSSPIPTPAAAQAPGAVSGLGSMTHHHAGAQASRHEVAVAASSGPEATHAVSQESETHDVEMTSPSAPKSRLLRQASVDETIDLAQQAEFFAVLGQEHAACDLLEAHLQQVRPCGPWSHLTLLDLYQRQQRWHDRERTLHAMAAHFDASPTALSEAAEQPGGDLRSHTGVWDQLHAVWSEPTEAADLLVALIARGRGDAADAAPFGLLAYRDLFSLYAAASDAATRVQHGDTSGPMAIEDVLAARGSPSGHAPLMP